MTDIKNSSEKVTLWTRQDIRSLEDLKKNGVVRIKRKHLEEKFDLITDYITKLYKWFVNEASKRVPKPEGVEFPVWCSVSDKSMLRPTIDTVVYVLEVDKSEIIYFDGGKWDYVLNHLYIPKDEKDGEEYMEDIKRKGFKDAFSFLDERTTHFYPQERKKIIDSWVRIFDIDEWDIFKVQANIWEIREDMVKDILYY